MNRAEELMQLTDSDLWKLHEQLTQIISDAHAGWTWAYYGIASQDELRLVKAEMHRRGLHERRRKE